MKSYKGGYTQDQVEAIKAHQKGQEMAENARETAKVMLELANGKVEDIKNVTEEQIAEALKKKEEMEEKIKKIMNDEELKAKITENVDKFKETLNNLKEDGLKLAMEKLGQVNKLREDVFSEENINYAKETTSKALGDAKETASKALDDAKETASALATRASDIANSEEVAAAKKFANEKSAEAYEKGAEALNTTRKSFGNFLNMGSNAARGALGMKKNLPPGINVTGEQEPKGGKRKNKTKKLTKKEKKMKKARK